jgi:hypothetical protein
MSINLRDGLKNNHKALESFHYRIRIRHGRMAELNGGIPNIAKSAKVRPPSLAS